MRGGRGTPTIQRFGYRVRLERTNRTQFNGRKEEEKAEIGSKTHKAKPHTKGIGKTYSPPASQARQGQAEKKCQSDRVKC